MVDIDELERLLAAATPWSQGRVLMTKETRRWTLEQIAEANMIERRMVLSDFTSMDKGRGRELIASCENSDNAVLIVTLHNSAPAILTEIRELRAENARLRMANRSLRRGLYGLTDSGDADEIATTLEAGGVVDWDKYPPNARAALGEPQ